MCRFSLSGGDVMPLTCTRCEGTRFLNLDQVDNPTLEEFDETGEHDDILSWVKHNGFHDVSVCDCCGDGEVWYDIPGEHNENQFGDNGPYAYNGGLPECY